MDENRLIETVSDLVREMAVVANKMENLTEAVVASNIESKDQNKRIDLLEKSRTQLLTLFGASVAVVGVVSSIGLWGLSRYVDERFDSKIGQVDFQYRLCLEYKGIDIENRPSICQ